MRETMKMTGVNGVEIVSMSDVPVKGVGIGSSSSFVVGLLNALYAYKGEYKSPEELAKDACKIEIDILKKPIGKQDQYIAAYGGLRAITFYQNEKVRVKTIPLGEKQRKELDSNLMLFFTGKTRQADTILKKQKAGTKKKMDSLKRMRNLAKKKEKHLASNTLDKFGELLHKNWLEKKQLTQGITDPKIDELYQKAIDAGALGGKICGAGGGGFFLFYCLPENQNSVRDALSELKEMHFNLEPTGSKIIHNTF